jgi:hypothetical protein
MSPDRAPAASSQFTTPETRKELAGLALVAAGAFALAFTASAKTSATKRKFHAS